MQQSLARGFKPLQLKLFMSNKYAYAQIVRMVDGHIVAASASVEKTHREDATKRGLDAAGCSRCGRRRLPRLHRAAATFSKLVLHRPHRGRSSDLLVAVLPQSGRAAGAAGQGHGD